VIFVDYRSGSIDLLAPLKAAGLPAVQAGGKGSDYPELEAADFAFAGRGNEGASLNIGIELKRLDARSTDLTQSIRSGRLAGEQLVKMLGPHGMYDYAWLVVQGTWRHDDKGLVSVYKGPRLGWVPIPGKMSAAEMEKHLLTLELCAGLKVRYTNTERDTVRFLGQLYRWWTDKDMDAHGSHLAVHQVSSFRPLSEFEQVVSRFPGIGIKKAGAVQRYFNDSLIQAVTAPVEQWAEVETNGRKLGMKTAVRIVAFCKGQS
jgi:ERCC4-type nuclease